MHGVEQSLSEQDAGMANLVIAFKPIPRKHKRRVMSGVK
jgi:hypothetical protein